MQDLLDKLDTLLAHVPLTSLVFIGGTILCIIGYANGTITFDQAYENVLKLGGGTAAVGGVRTLATHVKKKKA